LDGEEAFVEWTKTDSIYGARKLAETLSTQPHHNDTLAEKNLKELDSMVCKLFPCHLKSSLNDQFCTNLILLVSGRLWPTDS